MNLLSSFVAAQGYQGTPTSEVLRLELKPLFLPWRFLVLPLFRCGGGVERSFRMFCWKLLLRLGKRNKQGETKLRVYVPVNRSSSEVIVRQTWLVINQDTVYMQRNGPRF